MMDISIIYRALSAFGLKSKIDNAALLYCIKT